MRYFNQRPIEAQVTELSELPYENVTKDVNDNKLFIPFAGACIASPVGDDGVDSYLWSSEITEDKCYPYNFFVSNGNASSDEGIKRYAGLSVSGVSGVNGLSE